MRSDWGHQDRGRRHAEHGDRRSHEGSSWHRRHSDHRERDGPPPHHHPHYQHHHQEEDYHRHHHHHREEERHHHHHHHHHHEQRHHQHRYYEDAEERAWWGHEDRSARSAQEDRFPRWGDEEQAARWAEDGRFPRWGHDTRSFHVQQQQQPPWTRPPSPRGVKRQGPPPGPRYPSLTPPQHKMPRHDEPGRWGPPSYQQGHLRGVPLPRRPWTNYDVYEESSSRDKLTLLSWNILADSLVDLSYMPYCTHSRDFDWTRVRLPAIVQMIDEQQPEIICLQEDDRHEDLTRELGQRGYSGRHKKRTGDDKQDGCSTFWRTAEGYELIEAVEVEYQQSLPYLDRDNVALLVVLRDRRGRVLLVANTHLLFNPKRGDVKLAQARYLLSWVESVLHRYPTAALLICGDFNCTPTSAVYELFSTGELKVSKLNRTLVSGQMNGRGPITGPAPFQQARSHRPGPNHPVRHQGSGTAWGRFQASGQGRPAWMRATERHQLLLQQLGAGLQQQPPQQQGAGRSELRKGRRREQRRRRRKLRQQQKREATVVVVSEASADGCAETVVVATATSVQLEVVATTDEAVEVEIAKEEEDDDDGIEEEGSEGEQADGEELEDKEQQQEGEEEQEAEEAAMAVADSPTNSAHGSGGAAAAGEEKDGEAPPRQEGPPQPLIHPDPWSLRQHYVSASGQPPATHPLQLSSAYAQMPDQDTTGEPAFTSYHAAFKGCVDYVWYDVRRLRCVGVLEMPLPQELSGRSGLPCLGNPSDHLPLLARFALPVPAGGDGGAQQH